MIANPTCDTALTRLNALLNSIQYHRPEFNMPDRLQRVIDEVSTPLE